jgi:hypothetical protein
MATHCGHCGRDGTLEELKHVPITEKDEVAEIYGSMAEVRESTIAWLQRCTQCGKLTVSTYFWVDPVFEGEEDFHPTVVYPVERDAGDLPKPVAKRYGELLELQFAPDAFAVRAGRLLEAVCKDQGAGRKTLDASLKALVTDGHLPEQLVRQSHLVREYRNFGGHDSEIEPQDADVPLIRGFVEALLYNLYWGPAEYKRANEALERRKAAAVPSQP